MAEQERLHAGNTPNVLSALRLTAHQWRILALEIQKQAIVMFNGLHKLAVRERNEARKAA